MTNMETETRRGAATRWATLLTGLVLFLAGIGIGWLFTEPAPGDGADTPTAIDTTFEQSGSSTTTTLPDTVSVDPSVDGPTGEPIADVAEATLPAVVQIEITGLGGGGGVGTGVIFDESGLIMTAAHVVDGASSVTVRLSDGNKFEGTVLGSDEENDIAVISIDAPDLTAAPLALEDKPRAGTLAIALGSPWGLDSTVTSGIVSAVDRAIVNRSGTPRVMLQTDASINPGNSGGPLLDREGRVIGINVSIYSTSGANDGVGFAVPIDRAYRVARAIIEGRPFVSGFLGVKVENADDLTAGAVISEITPGTAAEDVGLVVGDVVLEVNGVPIADFVDLAAQVRAYEPGDTIELVVSRETGTETISVELGTNPADLQEG